LPERQINGSSYTAAPPAAAAAAAASGGFVPTFNRRVLYCAWDNLKDGQVFFAGSTDRNESRRRGAHSRSARSGPSSFCFFKRLLGKAENKKAVALFTGATAH